MRIEIKTGLTVLFSHDEQEGNTLKLTLEAAVRVRANLTGANLAGAYLARADLARAYLARAYLTGAYLDGASLTGAYLDGEILTKAPISIVNLEWSVLITDARMRIGCKRHTHAEWEAFDEKDIRNMERRAFDFWVVWRSPLLAMCAAHKAAA